MTVRARPITQELYRAYGDVIAARQGLERTRVNLGTAWKHTRAAELVNLRGPAAEPHLSVFRCDPAPAFPFRVTMLERHGRSTQVFLPMSAAARYLVIVALGAEQPDLGTLKAFLVEGAQGITYRPGVWHHPMIALDRQIDFACLVWEDGSRDDCDESPLESPIPVELA